MLSIPWSLLPDNDWWALHICPIFLCKLNPIKAHWGTGSRPFSSKRLAAFPPQADHVLVDLFSSTAAQGPLLKRPRETMDCPGNKIRFCCGCSFLHTMKCYRYHTCCSPGACDQKKKKKTATWEETLRVFPGHWPPGPLKSHCTCTLLPCILHSKAHIIEWFPDVRGSFQRWFLCKRSGPSFLNTRNIVVILFSSVREFSF